MSAFFNIPSIISSQTSSVISAENNYNHSYKVRGSHLLRKQDTHLIFHPRYCTIIAKC